MPDEQTKIALEKLKPAPWNPRIITDKRFKILCDNIEHRPRFFADRPILATKDGTIYAGNMRYRAAEHLGMTEVPARLNDISEKEAKEEAILDNNNFGNWQHDELATLLYEMEKDGTDISSLGLDEKIEDIIERLNQKDILEDEAPAPPKVAKTKKGDLYQLGDHRLLAGDATKIEDVEKLMGRERADLFLSDPPYGVSYVDKNEFLNSIGKPLSVVNRIENDHQTPEQMYDFWLQSFGNACISMKDVSSYYIFAPQGGDLLLLLLQAVRESGFQLKHVLIWAKNQLVLGRADYNYKHEPIVYGWKQNGTHEFYGKGDFQTSVWEYDKNQKNDLHPTMKPIGVLSLMRL